MGRALADEVDDTGFEGHLARLNALFENAQASEIIEWATSAYGRRLTLACSFQDVVVLDLALRIDPGLEVVFLDTGSHFPETIEFARRMQERYAANVVVLRPGPEADEWPCGSARCCQLRKVEPLRAHLADRDAWMTGLRRSETRSRADAPIVALDPNFGVTKINPLANWSDDQVAAYVRNHQLPEHPLMSVGYASIGCAPTTRPVAKGEDGRAGRWAGLAKTECGLHI
jgi:phosphoadenosine phosphosulfate reductase